MDMEGREPGSYGTWWVPFYRKFSQAGVFPLQLLKNATQVSSPIMSGRVVILYLQLAWSKNR